MNSLSIFLIQFAAIVHPFLPGATSIRAFSIADQFIGKFEEVVAENNKAFVQHSLCRIWISSNSQHIGSIIILGGYFNHRTAI